MDWNPLINFLRSDPLIVLAIVLAGFLIIMVGHICLYNSCLLAICPKIKEYDTRLIAGTSFRAWLLMLTMLYRRVIVDAERKEVIILRRLFWIFNKTRTIPFDQIQEIAYNYEDWGPYTSLGFTGSSKDCFSVKLRLLNDEEVPLFNFVGEGSFKTGLLNPLLSLRWIIMKITFAFCGRQEELSLNFVDRLEKLIGVRVSP